MYSYLNIIKESAVATGEWRPTGTSNSSNQGLSLGEIHVFSSEQNSMKIMRKGRGLGVGRQNPEQTWRPELSSCAA
jgi:hypothetical protein